MASPRPVAVFAKLKAPEALPGRHRSRLQRVLSVRVAHSHSPADAKPRPACAVPDPLMHPTSEDLGRQVCGPRGSDKEGAIKGRACSRPQLQRGKGLAPRAPSGENPCRTQTNQADPSTRLLLSFGFRNSSEDRHPFLQGRFFLGPFAIPPGPSTACAAPARDAESRFAARQ